MSAGAEPVLVWITGWPGCGKTTAGDYLEQACGFQHIDVDAEWYFPHLSGRGAPAASSRVIPPWLEQWASFFKGETPQEELFAPLLSEVCAEVAKRRTADPGASICITQGLHRQGRDYVRKALKDSLGADIKFIGLSASPEKKALRLMYKEERFTAVQGKNLAEAFQERTGKKFGAEAYVEDWKAKNAGRLPLMHKMDADEGEANSWNIDIEKNESTVLARLQALLGVAAVREVDAKTAAEASWDRVETHFAKSGT